MHILDHIAPELGAAALLLSTCITGYFVIQYYRVKRSWRKLGQLYETMNYVINSTTADRFTILKTSNGGGKIHPAHPIYVYVLHEDWRPPSKPIKHRYQRVLLDAEYVRLLDKLLREKEVGLKTSDMVDCFLRRAYVRMGVKYAKLYYLAHNSENIYYAGITTTSENGLTSASDMDEIYISINALRNIFKTIK